MLSLVDPMGVFLSFERSKEINTPIGSTDESKPTTQATTSEGKLLDEIKRAGQVLDILKEQVQDLQESLANLQRIFLGRSK